MLEKGAGTSAIRSLKRIHSIASAKLETHCHPTNNQLKS